MPATHTHSLSPLGRPQDLGLGPGPGPSSPAVAPLTADGSAVLRRGTASSVFLLRMSWCFPQVPALGISRVWCRMVNSRCLFIPRGLVSPGTCGWECSFLADLQAGVFGCRLWSSLLLELSSSLEWGAAHLTPVKGFSPPSGEFSLWQLKAPARTPAPRGSQGFAACLAQSQGCLASCYWAQPESRGQALGVGLRCRLAWAVPHGQLS